MNLEEGKCYITDDGWIFSYTEVPIINMGKLLYLPTVEKGIRIDNSKVDYFENSSIYIVGSVVAEFPKKEFDKLLKLYNTFLVSADNIIKNNK